MHGLSFSFLSCIRDRAASLQPKGLSSSQPRSWQPQLPELCCLELCALLIDTVWRSRAIAMVGTLATLGLLKGGNSGTMSTPVELGTATQCRGTKQRDSILCGGCGGYCGYCTPLESISIP